MSSHVTSAGFVPVDAVFSEDAADVLSLSAGEKLREARARAGLTLDAAAERTRIRRDYLEALETMDPRGLPARAYAIGYLRTYASALGLDGGAIVEQFKREVDTETGRAQPSAAAKMRKEIKLPRGVFGAVMILASVAAVAMWYADQSSRSPGLSNLPSPPDAAPEWARADFRVDSPLPGVDQIWNDLPLGAARETAVLRAISPTWLEVRDASGRVLFERELMAGETYTISEPGLTVSAENAGAIQVEQTGQPLRSLGEAGIAVEDLAVLAQAETADEPQ
jgi:transcriptional regulator with XRE-family HTH domain